MLTLDGINEQIQDEIFQRHITSKQHEDLFIWFKRYYKLCSTDPRLVNAKPLDVYQDYFDEVVYPEYLKTTDNCNPEVLKMLRGRINNENYDKNYNEWFKAALEAEIERVNSEI